MGQNAGSSTHPEDGITAVRHVKRTALVPYRPGQMYALVGDVDAYSEFLPWCRRSEVLRRDGNVVEAEIELEKGSVRKSFTTRNTHRGDEAIDIALVGGPFRHLAGGWRFEPVGDDGCRVSLALDFEFESRVVDALFGSFFETTCNALIDAFTRRAEAVYGER